MLLTIYYIVLIGLVLAELTKGLSANGTPPFLQKLPGQMHLAHFMWSNIMLIRVVLIIALVAMVVMASGSGRWIMIGGAVPLGLAWFGIFWLFEKIWTGRVKFPGITQKVFATAKDNELDPELQVIGVDHGGEQKAFPVNMITFHHQIVDQVADLPVWVTYCGLCRSGRVYDINVDGQTLDFTLVGAISFNATFEDNQTGTWWRQETGEAAKGKLAGRVLEDVPSEQMTLGNWLKKHPKSLVLQYDPKFTRKYNFINKLQRFEATKPAWHMQETPSLVIGVESDGSARGYDWEQLKSRGMVNDDLGSAPIVVTTDPDRTSAAAYLRNVDGEVLAFEPADGGMTDSQTGSTWDWFGTCLKGKMKGRQLSQIQSHQQYIRSWITFHPETSFYDF